MIAPSHSIRWLLLIIISCPVHSAQGADPADVPKLGKIEFIRPEIPNVTIPAYQGETYEDLIPDTLDLAERARLALNGMTSPTDPNADYEMYFYLRGNRNPPVMQHDFSDWCQPKVMEHTPLMRIMCGSDFNAHVDQAWMNVILKSTGPDGLFYIPTSGRPWFHIDLDRWVPTVIGPDGVKPTKDNKTIEQFAHPQPNGWILGNMTLYYLRTKDPMWKEMIERAVDRWAELLIDKGDWGYHPRALYKPGAKTPPDAEMPLAMWAEETPSRFIQGLAQAYRATGYKPALDLAGKLTRYLRFHGQYYEEDGRFLNEPNRPGQDQTITEENKYGGHFHAHTIGLLAMLEYALAADDRDTIEFVRRGFDYARLHPASSDLVGFFPEWLDPGYAGAETCEIADMIGLGIKLSNAGAGDYWDNVDRWVRNQFAESQLMRADWVYRMAAKAPSQPVAFNESADQAVERNIGAFAGGTSINDWQARAEYVVIMHCCTGNAVRSLYYAWENIMRCDEAKRELKVNLLLNRASPWADLLSSIPYTGEVELKIKQDLKSMLIRVPEWIADGSADVVCTVNGQPRVISWQGRYIQAGAVKAGDKLAVTFPIAERTVKARIGKVDATLVIKGNTVVFVDPPGVNCPIYQREHYRENDTRWRKVQRFVSPEVMDW